MTNWLAPALLSLFSFGLWGLFTKLSIMHIDSRSALIYQSLGIALMGFWLLHTVDFKPDVETKGLLFAILTGFAYGVGCLFYLMAASKGKIIEVVTLTALYPLVTIILACFFLKELVTLKQLLGIFLAILAIFLMSS